ncbi:lactate/malate family dehydrogenase [Mycoplasmopsis columbinasalis]|uniref:L-lactate dehydrogenase n=1 Tax=Mycoplasmopsis columbinasalis TaxID=114880 RepID=A0A449B9M4_9BACT|nr:L-lactate dehydrogenase [Mycoplasmopsis columbinasalis]VEU77867.1 L-lactate dehydrogenase [Mycoplasmopsis columbinasalis]
MKKIVVIGLGNVGITFTTIAVTRGLEAEYVFIDKNENVCEAHAHDLQDMVALMPRNRSTFRKGTFADAKGADVAIITASIPMKNLTDRLALAAENAKLMKHFGDELTKNGFTGVVVVASNPCDVMAAILPYASGIPHHRVISTGTLLDSARLKKFIGEKLNVAADTVQASVLGEHGASAMVAWSTMKIGDSNLQDLISAGVIKKDELDELLVRTVKEGLYIYNLKGNTQFGIGTSLYEITSAVVNDKRLVMNVGVKLPKEYKNAGIYTSIPVIVGKNGYEYLPSKVSFNKDELAAFEKSTTALAKVHKDTLGLIDVDVDFK